MSKSKITISIPEKAEILKRWYEVKAVDRGDPWSDEFLGEIARERGVYIFHKNADIKYIGMTGGKTMKFGKRLRRHLHESAAPKRYYPRIKELGDFRVSFMTAREILEYMNLPARVVDDVPKSVILMMEAALIHAYCPEFQQDRDEPKATSLETRRTP